MLNCFIVELLYCYPDKIGNGYFGNIIDMIDSFSKRIYNIVKN